MERQEVQNGTERNSKEKGNGIEDMESSKEKKDERKVRERERERERW